MNRDITVLNWNFELNGGGSPAKRQEGYELLASLRPHLVLRQEMWGADADGSTIMYEAEQTLGLRGWLGRESCTALFADTSMFVPVREWPRTGRVWELPPTALTLRYLPAGPAAMPLVAASYHLNYASAAKRLAEVEWLSTWADKRWTTPSGKTVRMPALLAGDNNSYPVPGTPNDPPLPVLAEIDDQPHRLHRSYVAPDGSRVMDTRPDEALRTAGLEDVARYWATARHGNASAVARTVDACETHGPDARIDRVHVTSGLLPAVTGVDVIEVPLRLSDHHIVRVTLSPEKLADVLNEAVS